MLSEIERPVRAVESGQCFVSAREPLVLEAYLGTCVGVTLRDRETGVGGLIHLLLPEAIGIGNAWRPMAYATTGMLPFVQKLLAAGASPNHLEACIAGGALIGPISKQDLDLDIGGRTTEVVFQFLKTANIPVLFAETGGHYGCRLSFDLTTFKTRLKPLAHVIENEETLSPAKPIKDTHQAMRSVSPIPQVALKIIRMINKGCYQMAAVGEEIKTDQVISANVIRICNSTFVGAKKKVDSIDRALILIGEQNLLELVVSASMELYFKTSCEGYSLCRGGLYQHALCTAQLAQKLARLTGKSSPDIAYTAGLLHDIGKVVLDQYLSANWPFFYRRTQVEGVQLCEAEAEKFGMSHPQTGWHLAKNWDLPASLCDAILHHHQPQAAQGAPDLTHIVYLADLLTCRFRIEQAVVPTDARGLGACLSHLGLKPSQLPAMVELIPQDILGITDRDQR